MRRWSGAGAGLTVGWRRLQEVGGRLLLTSVWGHWCQGVAGWGVVRGEPEAGAVLLQGQWRWRIVVLGLGGPS